MSSSVFEIFILLLVVIFITACGSQANVKTTDRGLISSLVISPDDKEIAIGSQNGITFVDSRSLKTKSFLSIDSWVTSIAYSPDGSQITAGLHSGVLKTYRLGDQSLLHTTEAGNDPITAVSYWIKGSAFMSIDYNGCVKIWSAETGAEQLSSDCIETEYIRHISVSQNGQIAVPKTEYPFKITILSLDMFGLSVNQVGNQGRKYIDAHFLPGTDQVMGLANFDHPPDDVSEVHSAIYVLNIANNEEKKLVNTCENDGDSSYNMNGSSLILKSDLSENPIIAIGCDEKIEIYSISEDEGKLISTIKIGNYLTGLSFFATSSDGNLYAISHFNGDSVQFYNGKGAKVGEIKDGFSK